MLRISKGGGLALTLLMVFASNSVRAEVVVIGHFTARALINGSHRHIARQMFDLAKPDVLDFLHIQLAHR